MNRFPLFFALLFSLTLSVMAQVPTGTVSGNVVDPSGAVIANATVTVTNKSNGATRVLQTDNNGAFFAAALPAGSYQITNLTGGNSVNAIASDGLIELKVTVTSAAAYKALVTAVTKAAADGTAAENAFRGVKTGDLTSGAPATVRFSVTQF